MVNTLLWSAEVHMSSFIGVNSMVTLEQTRKYDKMNLEQLEDLYTATIKSMRKTDDIQSQINLNSKLNYLYSIIMEKKNA